MGLVSRGMLWCYSFTNFVQSLYCYCQNGGKNEQNWEGVLMDKQNHPAFPYRPPNLLLLVLVYTKTVDSVKRTR